jgi:hypothetical protein
MTLPRVLTMKLEGLPSTKLAWAIHWARKGLFVFPVQGGIGIPAIDAWYKHATLDVGRIIEWWTQFPTCDVGCALDKSGHYALAVIGDDGRNTVADHEKWHGAFGPDFRMTTPWNNELLLFKGSAFSNPEVLGAGIHVIGTGRFIFLPLGQSRHVEEAPSNERAEQW